MSGAGMAGTGVAEPAANGRGGGGARGARDAREVGEVRDRPEPRDAPGRRFRLGARMRRIVLTVHVIVSVAWIGVDACLLALGLTGVLSRDPELQRAVYLIVGRIGTYFISPASLGALVTGLVLGLGTKWGLVRYRWVAIKLAMGVALTVGGNLVILWRLRDATAQVAGGVAPAAVSARYLVIGSSTAGTALLVTATVLSIYKPWGRTRWGRRPAITT